MYENEMNTAQIIDDDKKGQEPGAVEVIFYIFIYIYYLQRPAIYTSVYENHKTSVIHPVPQPHATRLPNREALYNFSSERNEGNSQLLSENVGHGVSVGVNLGQLGSDPTLKGYETPNYQKHREEENTEQNFLEKSNKNKSKVTELSPEESMEKDINSFLKQLQSTYDKDDKTKIINDGKNRLLQEAKDIKDTLIQELDDLLEAKKLALRINNVVNKYEKRARDTEKAKSLKLADEITVKELLKDKLHRQIQGLRLANSDYRELDQVDESVMDKIMDEILEKLGPY